REAACASADESRRGAGGDRAERSRENAGGDSGAWPEAVAGNRDAAGTGTEAAAARRTGRGDDASRARSYRRIAAQDRGEPVDPGGRTRHGVCAAVRDDRDRAAYGQAAV